MDIGNRSRVQRFPVKAGIVDRVQSLRDEIAFLFHNLNHNHNLTQDDYD